MVIKEKIANSSIEVLHRNKDRMDKVVTIKVTPRVERLREDFLGERYCVSIDKMRIETRVMKETEGQPIEIRRAKVFAAFTREIPISIFPDELIVGCAGDKPKRRYVEPEELEGIEAGVKVDKNFHYYHKTLNDQDYIEMKEDIIPYWKGQGNWEKTKRGRNYQRIPSELFNIMFGYI